jgi:3-oxoacyl-[acyl-carrier-protein] synthase II
MGSDVSKRRVVVTGLGLVTPLGIGVEQNWEAVCEGRSGITRIDRFDVSDLASQIGGLVRDFDPGQFMEKKEIKRTDPFVQFALASSALAMKDSGLVINNVNADRVAVVIG